MICSLLKNDPAPWSCFYVGHCGVLRWLSWVSAADVRGSTFQHDTALFYSDSPCNANFVTAGTQINLTALLIVAAYGQEFNDR